MILIRSARSEDLPGLCQVMGHAFSAKMHILFGRDPHKTELMLHTIYSGPIERGYDGIIVAEQEGEIIGGLVIEPMPWLPVDSNRVELSVLTHLSRWRQFWNWVGFAIFTHGPDVGDAYLSDVCVAESHRGRGVAQKMVGYAEEWAQARGRRALTLWVAAGNKAAIRAYEKQGMRIQKSEISPISWALFGIFKWVYMRKVLE
jgi:ribosomal protein S18 acetylase RimI-like enzyme